MFNQSSVPLFDSNEYLSFQKSKSLLFSPYLWWLGVCVTPGKIHWRWLLEAALHAKFTMGSTHYRDPNPLDVTADISPSCSAWVWDHPIIVPPGIICCFGKKCSLLINIPLHINVMLKRFLFLEKWPQFQQPASLQKRNRWRNLPE